MRALTIVAVSLLLLAGMAANGHASIVFIGDQGFTRLDGSGAQERISFAGKDLVFDDFGNRGGGWTVREPSGPPGLFQTIIEENGNLPRNLSFGAEIGDGLNWESLVGFRQLSNYDTGEWNFFDTEGFLGIRVFSEGLESLPSYGWIRIEHDFDAGTFTVHDWAWNTTPGEPILAGQIPEPAAYVALLGLGVLVFVVLRRRFDDRYS